MNILRTLQSLLGKTINFSRKSQERKYLIGKMKESVHNKRTFHLLTIIF